MIHWHYFIALEEDLNHLARFVDFSGQNDKTYSIEIAHLFLASCAELDVVLKQLAKKGNPSSTADNINAYFSEISLSLPNFAGYEVTIHRYNRSFTPWTAWASNQPPQWWTAHNKVKHQRHTHFHEATLENCLQSMTALFVSVIHLYAQEAAQGELLNLPKLFNVADRHFGGTQMGRHGHSFKYKT